MTTEYNLAVQDLQHFPLSKLKEFMKKYNKIHPVKGHAKMKKKEIIHFIATCHHNSLSGKGILNFGVTVLKKLGNNVLKDVKKTVFKGVKDLASTAGDILLKNIDEHATQPPQQLNEQQKQQQLQDEEINKEYQKYEKIRNEIKWGR